MQTLKAPHLDQRIGRLLFVMCTIFAGTVMAHTPFQCTHMDDLVVCPEGIPDHDMSDFISSPHIFWESGGTSDESPAPVPWMDESPAPVSSPSSPVSSSDTSVSPSPSTFDGFNTGEQQLVNIYMSPDGTDDGARNDVGVPDRGDWFLVAFFAGFKDYVTASRILGDARYSPDSTCDAAGDCSLGDLDGFVDPPCTAGVVCDAGALDVVFETTCDAGGGCDISNEAETIAFYGLDDSGDPTIFSDGFESGDTSAWSSDVGSPSRIRDTSASRSIPYP